MAKRPKEGDVFEIPLFNGEKAYGQYLFHSKMGPIIQVFDLISTNEMDVEKIILSKQLFPPVITGLYAAIKKGLWRVVGNRPIVNFIHPIFISTLYDQVSGKARIWFLWDGEEYKKIGHVLPEEYKKYEFLVVWDPLTIVQRIESGKMPFPYSDLIEKNEYTPQK
jgi:hypothetical protein